MRRRALLPLLLALACRSGVSREPVVQGRAPDAMAPVVPGDSADRAARDRLRRPERLVAALGLTPGQRVADIGAGYGYLTFRLAEAVGPTGRVVATDVDEAALAALRAHRPLPANIVARKVAADDPGLEPGAYDLVLLSEVDQYVPDRVRYLIRLRAALAPAGRIAVTNRRGFRPLLVAAAERAGYSVIDAGTDLPFHFLLFLQPVTGAASDSGTAH